MLWRFSGEERPPVSVLGLTGGGWLLPDQKQCTLKRGNRTITREEDEGLMEAMAARVAAHPEKMKLRKQLYEHPFGTINRWFGYNYFLIKGLEKVRCERNLMTLENRPKRDLNP